MNGRVAQAVENVAEDALKALAEAEVPERPSVLAASLGH